MSFIWSSSSSVWIQLSFTLLYLGHQDTVRSCAQYSKTSLFIQYNNGNTSDVCGTIQAANTDSLSQAAKTTDLLYT